MSNYLITITDVFNHSKLICYAQFSISATREAPIITKNVNHVAGLFALHRPITNIIKVDEIKKINKVQPRVNVIGSSIPPPISLIVFTPVDPMRKTHLLIKTNKSGAQRTLHHSR